MPEIAGQILMGLSGAIADSKRSNLGFYFREKIGLRG